MGKYIIKMKDGSGQHVMPAVHNTRKEAMLTLPAHITSVVEDRNDDCIGDPFNYTIEEVDEKDVNERITDFESARRALGRKLNTGFHVVKEKLSKSGLPLKGVIRLLEGINPKHIEALIALNQLFTIAEAWNKADGFVPDFSDLEQGKWFPWFVYDKDAAGFVFAYAYYTDTSANAYFGSRLCFKSSARAAQFGKQFIDLFNKALLDDN